MPYNETTIFIRAEFDDMLRNYCIAMHLFNSGAEIAIVREREILGYPKKMPARFNLIEKIKNLRDGMNVMDSNL